MNQLVTCYLNRAAAFLIVAGVSLQAAAALQTDSRIEIAESPASPIPKGMPVLRQVVTNVVTWKQGDPLFTIQDGTAVKAKGWAALSNNSILLKVVVEDESHANHRAKGDIWNGDCLQIGIDARGNGTGSLPPETPLITPNVGTFSVALTAKGAEIWAHFQGKYGQDSPHDGARHYPCSILRDETSKTTSYEIAFPLEEFSILPGAFDFVGLCVQVNDAEKDQQRRYYWGRGADGKPRPGLFVRLAAGIPSADLVVMEAAKTRMWTPSTPGEIDVAVAKDADLELSASMNGIEKKFRIGKTFRKDGIRRFIIQISQGSEPVWPLSVEVRLKDQSGSVLAERKVELTSPVETVKKLHEKIESLIVNSPHPLFTQHLRSLDAMFQNEWNQEILQFSATPNDEQSLETLLANCQTAFANLSASGGDWRTYLRGEQPLILARVARPDFTLQHFWLTMPRGWDANKSYPLIVDLHGMNSLHPLGSAIRSIEQKNESSPSEQDSSEPYFRLNPWGRGNSFYNEWGENDVFEALDTVTKQFQIDKNRIYLTGHSMGGGGAWGIGLRTPDRWAAVCPAAGGTWLTPLDTGLGANASALPFRIWHGEADTVVATRNAYDMQAELRAGGNEPDMVLVPEQGHDYPAAARNQNTEWLLKHERKRPDHFSFTADTDRWRGVWGIVMDRDPSVSYLPHFDCSIKDSEIRITSEGTRGLTVCLAEEGLGLKGPVTVWWNGRKSYVGPAKEIRLGDAKP